MCGVGLMGWIKSEWPGCVRGCWYPWRLAPQPATPREMQAAHCSGACNTASSEQSSPLTGSLASTLKKS